MKRILVTGSPRSGTGYMAQALSAATGRPFGHEKVFRWDGFNPRNLLDFDGDVSWLAAPLLGNLDHDEWEVWHVVRNPDDIIASLRGFGLFAHPNDHEGYYEWVVRHFPDLSTFVRLPRSNREVLFCVVWNEMVEAWVPSSRRVKVEKVTPRVVERIIGKRARASDWPASFKNIPTDYNSKGLREPVNMEEIEGWLLEKYKRLKERYGYEG